MIFHIFSALIFGCIFGCVFLSFWHQTGSQMAPKIDQEIQKKTKMLSTIPAQAAWPLFGHKFGSILVAIWDVLGIFWSPFGSILARIMSQTPSVICTNAIYDNGADIPIFCNNMTTIRRPRHLTKRLELFPKNSRRYASFQFGSKAQKAIPVNVCMLECRLVELFWLITKPMQNETNSQEYGLRDQGDGRNVN